MVKGSGSSFFDKEISTYKHGLSYQREKFKAAKHSNDYDSMCDSIENIKSEIKQRMITNDLKKDLLRIEKVCEWYRTKETKYIKNTPEGKQVVFPPNFHNKINHNLTIAYELIIKAMDNLKLL